jgi:hypothetical protein
MKGIKKLFKRGKKRLSIDRSSLGPPEPQPINPTPVAYSRSSNPTVSHVPSEVAPRRQTVASRPTAITPKPSNEDNFNHPQAPKMAEDARKNPAIPSTNGKSPPQAGTSSSYVPAKSVSPSSTEDDTDSGKAKRNHKGVSDSFKGLSATEAFEKASSRTPVQQHILNLGDAYDSIPLIEQVKLPRGGISMETKAVGRVQVRKALSFVS